MQACASDGTYLACSCDAATGNPDGFPNHGDLAGSTSGPKRVFATSLVYASTTAPTACQNAADAVALGGTWKPWLSFAGGGASQNAINRIVSNGPWKRLDGQVAFRNRAQLGTTPDVPIQLTEKSTMLMSGELAWTGTLVGGNQSASQTCGGWLSTQAFDKGVTGQVGSNSDFWTNSGTSNCDSRAHVYCLED